MTNVINRPNSNNDAKFNTSQKNVDCYYAKYICTLLDLQYNITNS